MAPTRPAESGAVPARGFGWDEKSIHVGVMTQKDAAVAYKAAGADGINIGDTEKQARAVADDINVRGGLFGRKLVLEFRDVATVDTATDPDRAANAACSDFKQDRPVVAVVNILTIMDPDSWRKCLADKGVLLLSAALTGIDDTSVRSNAPSYYPLATPSWNALAPVLVSRLKSSGYFTGWNTRTGSAGPAPVKVGVLVQESTSGARIGKTIVSALARGGYPGALTYKYTPPGNQIQGAVLYFAGNNVTHLISSDIELSAFMSNAESQGYRPRYGVSTYNSPLANLQGLGGPNQNKGAVGVGWAPNYDVERSADPGPRGAAQKRCDNALTAKGQGNQSERLAIAFGYSICDAFQLYVQAAQAGGGLDAAAVQRGSAALGPRLGTALGFASSLRQPAPFLPGRVRDIAWTPSCSCYRYGTATGDL